MVPELYCNTLATEPIEVKGRVLVTGATGYVGGLLIPELLARGYNVRAMVRAEAPGVEHRWPGAEICVADASSRDDLREALRGVDTAYYLIHSLLLGSKEFHEQDLAYARNFSEIAAASGVKRIIYLGGLGDTRSELSLHLRSRAEVAKILCMGEVPVTTFRAAIIVGSGSASYEIIRSLIKRLPVMAIPPWGRTKCQPIAIRDVIRYLVGALETPATTGASLDIGGPDVLTYECMLKIYAEVSGKRVLFFPFAYSNMTFYSFLAGLITPVPYNLVVSLMEGLKNDVLCENDRVLELIPFRRMPYREAIVGAMSLEERDIVHTRWSDAYPPAHELAMKLNEADPPPSFKSSYKLLTRKSGSGLFEAVCRIGGDHGWFDGNWMWRLRGFVDRLLSGVGTARGRRSSNQLRVNDVIDFWRVESIVPDRMLLLRAEMIMPGRAWLEFNIRHLAGERELGVKAYFQPRGVLGHIYWYAFLPFHFYIFKSLIRQIERNAPV